MRQNRADEISYDHLKLIKRHFEASSRKPYLHLLDQVIQGLPARYPTFKA